MPYYGVAMLEDAPEGFQGEVQTKPQTLSGLAGG